MTAAEAEADGLAEVEAAANRPLDAGTGGAGRRRHAATLGTRADRICPLSRDSVEAVEEPRRPDRRTCLGDPGGEQPVGGHDHDLLPGVGGPVRLAHDLAVAVLRSVYDAHVAVAAGGDAALGLALEDEHDVAVDVGSHQLLVEAARRAGAVLPPPVGPRADDVGAVHDDDRGRGATHEEVT